MPENSGFINAAVRIGKTGGRFLVQITKVVSKAMEEAGKFFGRIPLPI
jgi:hypothetical protein